MVRLFIKPNKEILSIVEKGIEKCNGNLLKFSKEVNICRTTIYHWLENKCWIDVNKLKKICEYCGLDYLGYIENKDVRSTRSKPEIFNKEWFKLNPNISLLLGWICTEGYIPKNSCRVVIVQNDINVLKKLKSIIEKEYPIKNNIFIRYRKNSSLEISSPMFWYILVNHFNIKEGKKNFIVSAPEQIFSSNKECKLAFLAASFEGDGSWPPKTLTMRMTSENYIKDCKKILDSLGFKSNAAPLTQKNTWILQICARRDILILIGKFIPFLFQSEKFNHFLKKDIFKDKFYENIFTPFDNEIIFKAKDKLKCTFNELSLKIYNLSGYKVSGNYIHCVGKKGFKRGFANIRLPMLVALSDILEDEAVIPVELKWVLYALNNPSLEYIKRKTAENELKIR